MKHTFVSSSPGQYTVTAITENPLQDVSLSKKSEEYSRTRTSRAKQLLNSLRNFTSAGTTPTASPNRSANSGVVCRIPRACCRYSSPQKQQHFRSSPRLRLSQTVINSDAQAFRRRTESDGSPGSVTGTTMDMRKQQFGQLSTTSSASSIANAVRSPEIRKPQSNQMSSIPKSLTEAKRGTSLANGGIAAAGANGGGGSGSLTSRIPTAPMAPSMVVGAGAATNLGRKTRVAAVAHQKTLLTSNLGVTSPPTQRPVDSHYGSVRRAEITKVIGQTTAVTATPAGAQVHQGNQTYTLIAYQPTQSDPHRKVQNQPAVLYAIPSSHAFLQQHQLHQITQQQQQQHSSQASLKPFQHAMPHKPVSGGITPAAVLMPSTLPGHAHPHVHGSNACDVGQQQRTTVTTTTTATMATPVHRPAELVCTCPPELHQALIEHHQQRQGQQNSQNFLLINRDQPALHTPDSGQYQCADLHCPQQGREMDAESHVNYLVTLFQVLMASGVRGESFVSAFRLLGLLPQLTDLQRETAFRAKNELQQVRVALSDLKQEQMRMKTIFAKEVQCCERQIAVQLKKYERRKGLQQAQPFYDTRIHKVRSDRQTLDNALAAYQTTWSSLIGQLADLEGVIEETGNDVLKGRCRITFQMVSALEDRLQLATSAIEFCCESDPLLRKSIWQHAENEMDSAEQETRILEEQLEQLSDLQERSARLNGTIATLKRLAKVNTNTRQSEQQLQRLQSLGGILNPTAADSGSTERKRLMATISLLQPDHDERMRSIEIQEALRERRKRVFRDPPVFKGPAKALLLNGIHISPIWPEGFSRKSYRHSTLTVDTPDVPAVNEEPSEIPNTTANLPQPLRLPLSTVLVSRLRNPNAPRAKRNARVKFNMQVYVDGEDQPLPLNCVPEEDNPRSARRKSAPALPSPDEATPPAPPPRLTSQSASAPPAGTTKCQLQSSPIKMLRYENMDMFLKNVQQLPASDGSHRGFDNDDGTA
ncbi:Coiled-coil domain-containing protein [Echinococcus granulosus]|uniref:Coiled-coil domain-containing protein n=1 Tax=Echinococcus granulosus TaxID=6210 RepID=W6UQE6_ECHGR|nr:Coiled-coil domain-containing protein [Echinococcus granulosus]EUB63433.1 Coiled-coil domain-containing protein [Echinococcus granulosus]